MSVHTTGVFIWHGSGMCCGFCYVAEAQELHPLSGNHDGETRCVGGSLRILDEGIERLEEILWDLDKKKGCYGCGVLENRSLARCNHK